MKSVLIIILAAVASTSASYVARSSSEYAAETPCTSSSSQYPSETPCSTLSSTSQYPVPSSTPSGYPTGTGASSLIYSTTSSAASVSSGCSSSLVSKSSSIPITTSYETSVIYTTYCSTYDGTRTSVITVPYTTTVCPGRCTKPPGSAITSYETSTIYTTYCSTYDGTRTTVITVPYTTTVCPGRCGKPTSTPGGDKPPHYPTTLVQTTTSSPGSPTRYPTATTSRAIVTAGAVANGGSAGSAIVAIGLAVFFL